MFWGEASFWEEKQRTLREEQKDLERGVIGSGVGHWGEGWEGAEYPGKSYGEEMQRLKSKREAGEGMLWGFPMETGIKYCFGFAIWDGVLIICQEGGGSYQRLPLVLPPTWGFYQLLSVSPRTVHSRMEHCIGLWSQWIPCQMNSSQSSLISSPYPVLSPISDLGISISSKSWIVFFPWYPVTLRNGPWSHEAWGKLQGPF